MSPESPGQQNDPTPIAPNRGVESGVLRPEDIKGLTPEQVDDRIREAIAKFNVAFEDFDPNTVREALRNEEPRVTSEILVNDLSGLEERLKAKLETTTQAETAEARNARLGQFVETHFSDVCPPEGREMAVKRCRMYEDDCRELFEEPDLELGEEDAADPELKAKIVEAAVQVAANDEAIAARTEERTPRAEVVAANDERIETGRTEISAEEARTPALEADVASAERTLATEKSREADKEADLKTIEQLQAEFNQLKAEKGTIGALKTLLEPGRLKSPEMKAKVQSAVATAQALVNAIPGKSEVVTRILDQSNITFAASSPVHIFAGFLAEADKSTELTDDEKAQIRQVLHKQADIRSGSDIAKVLNDGRGVRTTTDADGNVTTETIAYDKDNPAEIQPGQYLYEENGKPVLRLEVDSGKVLEFNLPEGSESDMGKVAIIGQTIDTLADMNLEGPIYQRGLTLEAGGRIDLNFPKDWVTTQRVLDIFFDKGTGWDNRLLTSQDTEQMKFLLQGNSVKGDAARADRSAVSATGDLTGQGILDTNGNIDWARFEEVVRHNREQLGKGQVDYGDVPDMAA